MVGLCVGGSAVRDVCDRVRAAGRLAWKSWKSILGADKYEHYLAHHRRMHPGCEPMSEREFWDRYYRDCERNPGARCC
ncbi:YbdD/YjiX family protein [Dermatophilus congolensis]|uniref:Uncharacterized small protein n=1 Tax=Dermatophilus congolensis TaxID=1863 RepID=A0A239VAN4_9MICO|nr:YbdD/YjiX family protein [Dermatophilus congolensis]MBO3130534.1 YbdD/YjiX family protein [Dermatophilus congolensis]MBO3130836.1 YbdD/YjiX family protein [Dermatophilus congolensis]MBO3135006.1 YbdD/YjiX family protein [Dermatophilus congolensis]MBO3137245.1 YbdD/YjiX family protein [Dermatophilus congolensis]MBO3139490.1 YbdD/YjiX family protein [Dermatophilus congolensis]